MKRILSIIVLVFITVTVAFGQSQVVISRINQVAASMKSLQADFVQTKYMKMMGDKMVSKGKMYYQALPQKGNGEGALHWEYTSPYKYTFILNGDKVLIKKAGTKQNVNRMFKEVAKFILNSIQGNCLTDTRNFKVSIEENGSHYIATLIPQKKKFRAVFPKIVFVFSKKSCLASSIIMYEQNGDRTEIVLNNIQINKAINPDKFSCDGTKK